VGGFELTTTGTPRVCTPVQSFWGKMAESGYFQRRYLMYNENKKRRGGYGHGHTALLLYPCQCISMGMEQFAAICIFLRFILFYFKAPFPIVGRLKVRYDCALSVTRFEVKTFTISPMNLLLLAKLSSHPKPPPQPLLTTSSLPPSKHPEAPSRCP